MHGVSTNDMDGIEEQMDRKLAINFLARTKWMMYDTVESTVQFCLQEPNVYFSTLLKRTYQVALTGPSIAPWSKISHLLWIF